MVKERAAPPKIADYSQASIKNAVREIGLFGKLTAYPIFTGIGFGAAGFLFTDLWILFALAGLGVAVGSGNAISSMFFRKHIIARDYIRDLQKKMELEHRRLKTNLRDNLEGCTRLSDSEELALKGLRQFDKIEQKFKNVHDLLQDKLDHGELTYGRFLGAAEQVYLKVLDHLNEVAATLKSSATIDVGYINDELERISRNENSEDVDQSQVDALEERRSLKKNQLAKVDKLLAENEICMTKMEVSSASIASMKTGHQFSEADYNSAVEQLTNIAKRSEQL